MSSMTLFILIVCVIAVLFLLINFLFAPHSPYQEKDSNFECGFHSFRGQTRSEFEISFILFSILYIVLEGDILLIYPIAVSAYFNEIYGILLSVIFIFVVTVGFVFELGKGALKLDSRQNIKGNNINSINVTFLGSNARIYPLESSFFKFTVKKAIFKHLTLPKIITGCLAILIGYLFKMTGLASEILIIVSLNPCDANQYILSGFVVLVSRLGILGICEEVSINLPIKQSDTMSLGGSMDNNRMNNYNNTNSNINYADNSGYNSDNSGYNSEADSCDYDAIDPNYHSDDSIKSKQRQRRLSDGTLYKSRKDTAPFLGIEKERYLEANIKHNYLAMHNINNILNGNQKGSLDAIISCLRRDGQNSLADGIYESRKSILKQRLNVLQQDLKEKEKILAQSKT